MLPLETDGSFVLNREVLEEVLGETLPFGVNTIYLRATDEHDNESEVVEFEFTLKEEDLLGPEIESLAGIYGLNSYPVAVSLPPNGTGQLSVKINNWANSPPQTQLLIVHCYSISRIGEVQKKTLFGNR